MFRINRRAVSATAALVSLARVWVIWEDLRCMVTEWNAIRTLRHWRAPGQWWCVSLTRRNSTQIHTKYKKFSDSAWLSYTFLYMISNPFDPKVNFYVISERPSYSFTIYWLWLWQTPGTVVAAFFLSTKTKRKRNENAPLTAFSKRGLSFFETF